MVAAAATFAGRLAQAVRNSESLLCLGLDPDGGGDAAAAERQCRRLLDATLEHVCAVKPNLAFFEQYGSAGYALLERLRSVIPTDRLLILDAKRGDVGNTAEAYALKHHAGQSEVYRRGLTNATGLNVREVAFVYCKAGAEVRLREGAVVRP